jgi:opacity protein-like surface antigen
MPQLSFATGAALLSLLSFLVAPESARAQATHTLFGVAGSLTIPTGDYHQDPNGDGYNVGWQGKGLIELEPSPVGVGLRFEASYGENAANSQLRADLTSVAGLPLDSKIKQLGGMVDLIYPLSRSPGSGRAYLLTGLGVYRVSVEVSSGSVSSDTSGTEFAWSVGAGLRAGRSPLFFEVRYVSVAAFAGLKTNFVPVTAGIRFRS